MNYKRHLLLLLFACAPLSAQELQLSNIDADATATVGAVDSLIQSVEGRGDLDEDTKNTALENLRNARTQIEAKAAATAAVERYIASLSTAPAELEQARAALDERAPEKPTPDSLGISDASAPEELQLQLANELAKLTLANSEVTDLSNQVETQIGRPAVAHERIGQLSASRQELAALVDLEAAPDEAKIVTDTRKFAARLQRSAELAEISKLEQELLSHPIRLSLLRAQRGLRLRSQAMLGERVSLLRTAVNDRRQSAAELAQEAAASAELAAVDKHPVLRTLAEDNAELTRELPRHAAKIEDANEQLDAIRVEAATIEQRFARSEQLFKIGGLNSTIGHLLIEEQRTLPQVSLYRAQMRARRNEPGEVGLAQIRLQEQRRELSSIDQRAEELSAVIAVDVSDPTELASMTTEIRFLLRERRDLLLQVEDGYSAYLQTLSDLDIEQRRFLETTGRYKEFLATNLLWIPSAPLLFTGSWQDIWGAITRAFSPDRWLGTVAVLTESISNRLPLALLLAALLLALIAWRRPLAQRYAAMSDKVGRPAQDTISLTVWSLGIVIVWVLPIPFLLASSGLMLSLAPLPTVMSDAIALALILTGPFLFNVLMFRGLSAKDGILKLHFGWHEDNLEIVRRQLNRLATIAAPLLFVAVWLFQSDVASDQATVGRAVFIALMIVLATAARPLMQPREGIIAANYQRYPDRWTSRLRWVWFLLAVGMPLLLAVLSALGYLYTSAILAASFLETFWRLLTLGLVYLILLRWFALARRKLARQLAIDEMNAKLAAEVSEVTGDVQGEFAVAAERPLDIDEVDQQTKILLRSALVVVAVLLIWSIWAEILPAFTVLDQVALWNQTITVDGVQVIAPVTLANLILAFVVAVVTYVVSTNLPGLMEIALLQQLTLQPGSRYAIKTLVRYVVVTVGTITVLGIVGWNWSQIQWLVAALSVGLGFGLQEIVANFVSGLVILFERPIRVGDTVTVGQLTGTVTRVRIRATTITDWDHKEIIVPNKAFITEQVVNWTLTDPVTRIVVKVCIAFASDVELAHKVMADTLAGMPTVLEEPPPKVYFLEFGDSSLNFTLHAFSRQLSDRLPMIDEIHREILKALTANGISIPFPQRDLHIRSSEESK